MIKPLLKNSKRIEFIQKLICKHEWMAHGWSYIKCKSCDKVRHDPEKCSELHNKLINKMVDRGIWKEGEATRLRQRSGMFS